MLVTLLKKLQSIPDLHRWAAFGTGVLLLASAVFSITRRFDWYIPRFPEGLFWDSRMMVLAGEALANGVNPYEGALYTGVISLPYVTAPFATMLFGGMSTVLGPLFFPLLAALHVTVMIATPIILCREFLGRDWRWLVFAYGMFLSGLDAMGVTMLICGNFGGTFYMLIFLAMIPGLRRGNWLWFHIAVGAAIQLKFFFLLFWALPVMLNGWSWKQFRDATIAAVISALPFAIAYLIDKPFFMEWIRSLSFQIGTGDAGNSYYGAVPQLDPSIDGLVRQAVHVLAIGAMFVFLLMSRVRGWRRAAALIAFIIVANPRMKEYDILFAAIPVAALYYSAFAGSGATEMRKTIGVLLTFGLTIALLPIGNIPYLSHFLAAFMITGAVFTLAAAASKPSQRYADDFEASPVT